MLALLGGRKRATRKGLKKGLFTRKNKEANPGPSQCHPSLGNIPPGSGCLPIDVLSKAAKKLHIYDSSGDAATLRKMIQSKVNVSGGERTFLNALPLSQHEKSVLGKKYLRPPAPKEWTKDPDMWLDTNNIADVMNQYEEARTVNGIKEFEFMGPFPSILQPPTRTIRVKRNVL